MSFNSYKEPLAVLTNYWSTIVGFKTVLFSQFQSGVETEHRIDFIVINLIGREFWDSLRRLKWSPRSQIDNDDIRTWFSWLEHRHYRHPAISWRKWHCLLVVPIEYFHIPNKTTTTIIIISSSSNIIIINIFLFLCAFRMSTVMAFDDFHYSFGS